MAKYAVLIGLWLGLTCPASAAPSVSELIDGAVESLHSASYEAQMQILSELDHTGPQKVHIYHVSPYLYHVQPLVQDLHGQWNEVDYFLIENYEELVWVWKDSGKVLKMPKRLFALNTSLTTKFLRDLSTYEGTVVLDGKVGDNGVHILRQEPSTQKPYTITVGLDKRNYFPLYLSVEDGWGEQRVFFEINVVEYKGNLEFQAQAEELFSIPEVEQISPPQRSTSYLRLPQEENESGVSVELAPIPLFPNWLPDQYRVDGLYILDYSAHAARQQAESLDLVYQMEVIGPGQQIMSIFQTMAMNLDGIGAPHDNRPNEGVFVHQAGEWLVVVFGNLSEEQLEQLVANLAPDELSIERLIEATRQRDEIIKSVADSGD